MAAGLHRDSRARRQVRQPTRLSGVLNVIELGDQVMPRAAALEIQLAMTVQVVLGGIQAERQAADATDDKVVRIRACQPHGNVSLTHRQAQFSRIRDQLDHDVGVLNVQRLEARPQYVAGDGLRAGNADEAGPPRVAAAHVAFQGKCFGFQALCLLTDTLPGKRRHISVRRAVQEAHAEGGF